MFLPYQETKKILQLFVGGYTMQGIYDLRYPLSPEMEDAVLRLRAQLNTNELISATKKQAQYLALQNQINPTSSTTPSRASAARRSRRG